MGCACSEERKCTELSRGKAGRQLSRSQNSSKTKQDAAQSQDFDVGLRSLERTRRILEPLQSIYRILTSVQTSEHTVLSTGEHIQTRQRCRIKLADKSSARAGKAKVYERVLEEAKIMRELDHPHILKVLDVFDTPEGCAVVSDGFDGKTLQEYMEDKEQMEERKVAEVMRQLLSAVHYCHKRGIILRKLTTSSIIFDSATESGGIDTRIADLEDCCRSKTFVPVTFFSPYTAPEAYTKNYSNRCDIWSCGILMFFLLYGKLPNEGLTRKEIQTGKLQFAPVKTMQVSSAAAEFLSRLLAKSGSARPSAERCLSNPWLHFDSSGQERRLRSSIRSIQSVQEESSLRTAIKLFLIHWIAPKGEIAALKKSFEMLDLNGDGQISKEELLTGLQLVMPENQAAEEVKRIMDIVDKNQNGFIDYSEFLISSFRSEKLLTRKNLLLAFNSFDTDKNGTISLAELKEVLCLRSNDTEKTWQALMSTVDSSGDGQIDYQEFRTLMLQLSDEI